MNAIKLSHINKSFGDFAIRDLNLTVPSGTICGLVGENGAGKSTTIRLLMGALRPDAGAARVLGADVSSPEFLQVKEDVGVVLDEAYFPESLNAVQVGKIMAATYRRWDQAAYDGCLKRFDLPGNKQFKDFSRGMRMKLAIVVALSHQPKLLVLDEVLDAVAIGMLSDEELAEFLRNRPEDLEVVMTGRAPTPCTDPLADYITCMEKVRHPFDKGLNARKGVEF